MIGQGKAHPRNGTPDIFVPFDRNSLSPLTRGDFREGADAAVGHARQLEDFAAVQGLHRCADMEAYQQSDIPGKVNTRIGQKQLLPRTFSLAQECVVRDLEGMPISSKKFITDDLTRKNTPEKWNSRQLRALGPKIIIPPDPKPR